MTNASGRRLAIAVLILALGVAPPVMTGCAKGRPHRKAGGPAADRTNVGDKRGPTQPQAKGPETMSQQPGAYGGEYGTPNWRPPDIKHSEGACRRNLRVIVGGINKYWKEQGRKPASLGDLFPRCIRDRNALHCPYVTDEKEGRALAGAPYAYWPNGVLSKETFEVLCVGHFLLVERDGVVHRVVQ